MSFSIQLAIVGKTARNTRAFLCKPLDTVHCVPRHSISLILIAASSRIRANFGVRENHSFVSIAQSRGCLLPKTSTQNLLSNPKKRASLLSYTWSTNRLGLGTTVGVPPAMIVCGFRRWFRVDTGLSALSTNHTLRIAFYSYSHGRTALEVLDFQPCLAGKCQSIR